MTRDQLDPSILDLDPEKSLKTQTEKRKDEGDGPPLRDDPTYAKYFKMIKMVRIAPRSVGLECSLL